jgi:hypothetical protein
MRPVWSVNLNPARLCPAREPARLAARQAQAFALLEDLGVGGVRLDLDWGWLEPAPGRPDLAAWRWYEAFLAEAARRGLAVYGLLYQPPPWARSLWREAPTAFLAAWEAWVQRVGRAWPDGLAVVQAWNEPNNYVAALKGDAMLFDVRRVGGVEVPVGVPWEALAALFRAARAAFPRTVPIAVNPLANLLPPWPSGGCWLDWLPFTERLLREAGDAIDVVALDHYPDTWHPGTGPLEWSCLQEATGRLAAPGSPWRGKALAVGELGYASAPAGPRLGPWRWFPATPRGEDTMAAWYAAALPHVVGLLAEQPGPRTSPWINVYELFDAPLPVGGSSLLAIEDHFGLVRRDGTPKPAYAVVRALVRGEPVEAPPLVRVPAPRYWRWGGWLRGLVTPERPRVRETWVLADVAGVAVPKAEGAYAKI